MLNFTKNNRIINSHFRLHYKILLSFIIMSCVFAISVLMIFSIAGAYISPTIIETVNSTSSDGSLYELPLAFILFGPVGFILFSIFAIVLINVVIIDEVKTGNIIYWMTTNNSRFQIILSKIGFIWLSMLTIFAPYFMVSICYSTKASDFSNYAGLVIARTLEFLVFILMVTLVYMLIGVLLINKFAIFLSICIIFIAYSVAVHILPTFLPDQHWIKYISPTKLIADPLLFNQPIDLDPEKRKIMPPGQSVVIAGTKKPVSLEWNIGSVFINLFIAISASISSIYIYKKLDFNV